MATMTAPAPTIQRTASDETPLLPGSHGCDRSDCPAPATHRVELLDQDFYFCGHHWREMIGAMCPAGARTTSRVPAC